jgi:hypothetical protein
VPRPGLGHAGAARRSARRRRLRKALSGAAVQSSRRASSGHAGRGARVLRRTTDDGVVLHADGVRFRPISTRESAECRNALSARQSPNTTGTAHAAPPDDAPGL